MITDQFSVMLNIYIYITYLLAFSIIILRTKTNSLIQDNKQILEWTNLSFMKCVSVDNEG